MEDRQREFNLCLDLLRKIVTARGRDPSRLELEYVWPGSIEDETNAPKTAVSLAPLLTGGGHEAPASTLATSSGVVPVPPGIAPPKR
jgi:hypothetical protein